jgi:tetratricopeptide (TPR) repeat protein
MRLVAVILLFVAAVPPIRADALDDLREAASASARQQHEEAIQLYSRAIAVPNLKPAILGEAHLGRALEYNMAGDNDKAVADYDKAIALGAGYEAHEGRGWANRDAGRLDQALADFDAAVKAAPEVKGPYLSRAGVWRAKGAYDRALADLGEALRIEPGSHVLYVTRGKIKFLKSDYNAAAEDFARAQKIAPGYGEPVLWLHLARLRAGQDDAQEFARFASQIDLDDWPGQIVGLYLGRRSAATVLTAAARGSAEVRRIRGCEAALHLGLYALARKNQDEARARLEAATEACTVSQAEDDLAAAELKRLGN